MSEHELDLEPNEDMSEEDVAFNEEIRELANKVFQIYLDRFGEVLDERSVLVVLNSLMTTITFYLGRVPADLATTYIMSMIGMTADSQRQFAKQEAAKTRN